MSIASHRTVLMELCKPFVQAYDHSPKALPTPCAVIGFPTTYTPGDTLSDTAAMTIPVVVYVGYGDNKSAEDNLEALIEELVPAIEADDAYAVAAVKDFGLLENSQGTPTALACTIEVDIL